MVRITKSEKGATCKLLWLERTSSLNGI